MRTLKYYKRNPFLPLMVLVIGAYGIIITDYFLPPVREWQFISHAKSYYQGHLRYGGTEINEIKTSKYNFTVKNEDFQNFKGKDTILIISTPVFHRVKKYYYWYRPNWYRCAYPDYSIYNSYCIIPFIGLSFSLAPFFKGLSYGNHYATGIIGAITLIVIFLAIIFNL